MTAEKPRVGPMLPCPGHKLRSVSFESLEQTCLPVDQAAAHQTRAKHEVAFVVGESTIAVRFSRASAAAAFAARFGDMLATRAPDVVVYAVAFDGEAFFWRYADRVRRWPESLSDDLLVFFADNVALHEYFTTSRVVGIHAAVVAIRAQVVALVGPSSAGKTTTAIAAARAGFTLYSDDRCVLTDGYVVPFLRAITVREGGRAALLADALPDSAVDARLRACGSPGETTISPRALLGEAAGGPPRALGALFLIDGRAATPRVETASPYAVLPALLQSMVSAQTGIDRPARLLTELRDVAVYRLRLGTPAATAHAIETTLEEAPGGPRR